MDLDLAGNHALVTGPTAGIGRAIAEESAAESASVTVNGRDPGRVEKAVREIFRRGKVSGCAADLATAAGPAGALNCRAAGTGATSGFFGLRGISHMH